MSEKIAAPPIASLFRNLGQRALASGGLSAVGGAAGGGLGAAAGGVRGYQRAKEEGRSGLSGALQGGLRGAAGGVALGAAAGGVAGAAGGGRAQKLVRSISKGKGAPGAVSRFGERQVHSLTGAMPQGLGRSEGLRAMGASPVADTSEKLMKAIAESKGPLGALTGAKGVAQDKTVASLTKALGHAEKAEELGMTSVPGALKAFATKPVQALKAGAGREWHDSPTVGGKLMTLGLPAGLVASEAARSSKPGEEGRASRTLSSIGLTAPFSLTPMGFTGGMLASTVLGGIGSKAGKLMSKKKKLGQNPGPPVPEEASESGSVEHELSPRASGEFSE